MLQKQCEILCIEDNPGDMVLLESYLNESTEFDCQLLYVQTLREALTLLSQSHPDIILLDLSLPDSQGIESILAIQNKNFNVPIIVLTGQIDDAVALEAIKVGAQDYLRKDELSPRSLQRAIRYAKERHSYIERYQMIEQKRTSLEMRIENEHRITQLFTAVHHEFRTPLAIIKSSAGLLLKSNPTPFVERHYANIETAVDRLVQIINYMAVVARTSGEQLDIESQCNLSAAFIQVLKMLSPYSERVMVHDFADCLIRIDKESLLEILYRTIQNALQFSPPPNPVDVIVEMRDDSVVLHITDQGVGIPLEHQEKIFLPFYKVKLDHVKTPFVGEEGPGLGLTLARVLAHYYGGSITVNSVVEQGSTFVLTLPLSTLNSSETIP